VSQLITGALATAFAPTVPALLHWAFTKEKGHCHGGVASHRGGK
jgi:hypothetical protein